MFDLFLQNDYNTNFVSLLKKFKTHVIILYIYYIISLSIIY